MLLPVCFTRSFTEIPPRRAHVSEAALFCVPAAVHRLDQACLCAKNSSNWPWQGAEASSTSLFSLALSGPRKPRQAQCRPFPPSSMEKHTCRILPTPFILPISSALHAKPDAADHPSASEQSAWREGHKERVCNNVCIRVKGAEGDVLPPSAVSAGTLTSWPSTRLASSVELSSPPKKPAQRHRTSCRTTCFL